MAIEKVNSKTLKKIEAPDNLMEAIRAGPKPTAQNQLDKGVKILETVEKALPLVEEVIELVEGFVSKRKKKKKEKGPLDHLDPNTKMLFEKGVIPPEDLQYYA